MTRDPDLGLDAGAPLDPELEAAAHRQLRRLADAIDVDPDVPLDLAAAASRPDPDDAADTSDAGDAIPVRRRRARVALLAAAALAVVALGAAVVLVTTGGSSSDDVAAGDRDDRAGDGEQSSVAAGEQPGQGEDPVPTELPHWLAGPWLAQDDQPMPTDGRGPTLGIYQGAEHCSWEQVTFVELSWPPGFIQNPLPLNRQFARDPADVLGADMGVRGSYDGDATLPADAMATELHNAEAELWVAESTPDALYVRRSEGTVERWPRVEPLLLCA
jgi:hypothetical protein